MCSSDLTREAKGSVKVVGRGEAGNVMARCLFPFRCIVREASVTRSFEPSICGRWLPGRRPGAGPWRGAIRGRDPRHGARAEPLGRRGQEGQARGDGLCRREWGERGQRMEAGGLAHRPLDTEVSGSADRELGMCENLGLKCRGTSRSDESGIMHSAPGTYRLTTTISFAPLAL